MQTKAQEDIRRLLRSFGTQADETITAYLRDAKPSAPVRVRIVLDEAGAPPASAARLHLEVEGEIGP